MPPTLLDHPLAADLLTRLRARGTSPADFRELSRRLAVVLVLEATRDLPVAQVEVRTPMAPTTGAKLWSGIVAVPVLRAGLGMLPAVLDLFPNADVGPVGLERDELTLEPREYYAKFPPLEERQVLVLDPMLATGGSGSAACAAVKRAGASDIRFVCVVAAPEGIARMEGDHPDVPIVAAAVDERLDDSGFIVPGLGDFGDRLFGTSS
ncbi:MAG: uracil phosphoribosyltransferase [Actinomycetota bacterium]